MTISGAHQRAAASRKASTQKSASIVRALALLCQLNLQQGRLAQAKANAQRLDDLSGVLALGFPQSAWRGISLLAQARIRQAEGDAAGGRGPARPGRRPAARRARRRRAGNARGQRAAAGIGSAAV